MVHKSIDEPDFNSVSNAIPIRTEPMGVAVVGGEIVLNAPPAPSLTADAAEATGQRLIDAARELRDTPEREIVSLSVPGVGRTVDPA